MGTMVRLAREAVLSPLVHATWLRFLPVASWSVRETPISKPSAPACTSHSDLLVSHGQDSGFVAWHAEWFFNTFSARARATNVPARTQKDPLDCLLSPRIMDRSIYSDFARDMDRFSYNCSPPRRDERGMISVSATPAKSVTPKF